MQLISPTPVAMSSREIGDLLDARHDSVKRTIERLAEKDVIRFTQWNPPMRVSRWFGASYAKINHKTLFLNGFWNVFRPEDIITGQPRLCWM
ncbi:hypothetical protein [Rhizobium binxianense]|uniref:hypothetical protein n=1 Tax=Rhizobium binxianense TaxID=3024242 RepID=UPI00234FA7C4|nr:hypothetical protein [Rhizobium sp. BC56]MDC7745007.1 hypothetical protein [Rhizobium sp. BC56]